MSSSQGNVPELQRAVSKALHAHWKLYLIEGIVLMVLGAAAILLPPLATLALTILFGWLFLLSGIIGLVTTFMLRHAPGFWWSLISAALAVLVGGMLLARPITGAVSLTLLLVAFFLIEGVASIMFALEHKRELSSRWAWMLVSGVIDLILGVIILAGLPGTAAWALGLLLGINMMFGGAALISMALAARNTV